MSRPPDPFGTDVATPLVRPMRTIYTTDATGSARWYRRTFPGTVELCPGYPTDCRLDKDHAGECSTEVRADEISEF